MDFDELFILCSLPALDAGARPSGDRGGPDEEAPCALDVLQVPRYLLPEWMLPPLGPFLEEKVFDAGQDAAHGRASTAIRQWGEIHRLVRLMYGPEDPRAWAALSRKARIMLDAGMPRAALETSGFALTGLAGAEYVAAAWKVRPVYSLGSDARRRRWKTASEVDFALETRALSARAALTPGEGGGGREPGRGDDSPDGPVTRSGPGGHGPLHGRQADPADGGRASGPPVTCGAAGSSSVTGRSRSPAGAEAGRGLAPAPGVLPSILRWEEPSPESPGPPDEKERRAEPLREEAASLSERLGETHPDALAAKARLADFLKGHAGPWHPLVPVTKSEIISRGLAEPLELWRGILAAREAADGADSSSALAARSEVASLAYLAGDMVGATSMRGESLAMAIGRFGELSGPAWLARFDLAVGLYLADEFDAAAVAFASLAALRKAQFGPADPDVAISAALFLMAESRGSGRCLSDSLDVSLSAADSLAAAGGDLAEYSNALRFIVSRDLEGIEDAASARLLGLVRRAEERRAGNLSPFALRLMNLEAEALGRGGGYAECDALKRRELVLRESPGAPDDPAALAKARYEYAKVIMDDDPYASVELFCKAADWWEASLLRKAGGDGSGGGLESSGGGGSGGAKIGMRKPGDDRMLIAALAQAANVADEYLSPEKRLALNTRYMETSSRILGPRDESTLGAMAGVANAMWRSGTPGAEEFYRKSLAEFERVLGQSHHLTIWARHAVDDFSAKRRK
ncbi:MAG: hypothetical protein LBR80_16220 [Deltaproteobacteria bacterium]|jgi:hypothetical protein|nr:hypothetical protein [Deltaproteobacteria bacterium]